LAGVFYHEPVLLREAAEMLLWNKDKTSSRLYVDCTLGGGSYTNRILESTSSDIKVLALDRDENAIRHCTEVLKDYPGRVILFKDNFANIVEILNELAPELSAFNGGGNVVRLSGAVLDLGLSTFQLDHEDGFSYQRDTELDMRAGTSPSPLEGGKGGGLKAKDVLNTYSEKELVKLFRQYGELRYSKQITREIVKYRQEKKFEMTLELAELLREKIPARYFNKDMSKVFQALRIEVNNELVNLTSGLSGIAGFLESGARIVCVSYHSLEDRIVKNFFRSEAVLEALTKKPVLPSEKEISRNVRARSAKLRGAQKK